jgi:hypothetical protein
MFPELQATIERFTREMGAVDEMVHVLLKGHLLLEEALALILDQHVFHREYLADARLSFAQKTHIARSLCLRKNTLGEWELVAAINAIRNDLAHSLNSPSRARKLEKVKELYFREAAGFHRLEEIKHLPDHEIVFGAYAHCAGFLATCASDLRSLRGMIHAIDREMNPDLPSYEL